MSRSPQETLNPSSSATQTPDQSQPSNPPPSKDDDISASDVGEKRKREEEGLHPLYKTSLCSYFRRNSGSCDHGSACRYAHGEEELRPRPDNSWDPTSERAKKAPKLSEAGDDDDDDDAGENEVMMMTDFFAGDGNGGCLDAGLSKCLVHLPRKWGPDHLRNFLQDLGIVYKSAKKKKGMTVGFVTFESTELLKVAVEGLEGKSVGNKTIKVADVIPRTYDDKIKSAMSCTRGSGSGNVEDRLDGENGQVSTSVHDAAVGDGEANGDDSVVRGRSIREVVTPLAHLPYGDQLEQKKSSVMQMLKKLTRNARKACPNSVSVPEWILKSREIGGLPCKLEGIIGSPLINGYRNKCEFSVGYSLQGKPTVGFLLGNFREGVTAVDEPVDCPNVSRIACKYASIFQEFLQQSGLPIWNRFKNTGFWRQLTVREGRQPGKASDAENHVAHIAEVMLIVQVCTVGIDNELVTSELSRLANAFVTTAAASSPSLPLTYLVVQDHQGISNVATADAPLRTLPFSNTESDSETKATETVVEARIHDYISNLRFSISPTAFFQVNTLAAEKLYSLAGDWAGLDPDTLLFDICCGTGTIGLTLAHQVGMVVGIEMNASAVEDARRNAEINGINNCRFVCAKAEDVMGSLLKEYLSTPHLQDEVPNTSEGGDKDASPSEEEGTSMDDEKYGDKKTNVQLEKGEDVPAVQENGQELESYCQKNCTSEDGIPSVVQFKNVVAIVDPPRGGLHPTVIKALRTHSHLRQVVYISCNPETLVANAIELCTPSPEKIEKGNKNNQSWRRMSSAGLARHRAKSMPISEPFRPVKAMAVDLFPHTAHCEVVMLLER